ncbi:TPA: hypothetical protein ACX96Z_004119 [Clostridium sporogenes]
MIFIKSDARGNIIWFNSQPFHPIYGIKNEDNTNKTEEELLKEGILVESIKNPERIEGKYYELKVDVNTKKIYYEYKNIPKTKEELLQEENERITKELLDTQEILLNKEYENLLNDGGIK